MRQSECDNANNCTPEVMHCVRKFHMCSMSVKIQLFNTYCSPMGDFRIAGHFGILKIEILNHSKLTSRYLLNPSKDIQ